MTSTYQDLVKKRVNEDISRIKEVLFTVLSPEEILKRSVCEVDEPTLYDTNGNPKKNSLFDTRMGVIDRDKICKTCKHDNVKCPGHNGHIRLASPVYNISVKDKLKKILQSTCIQCSKLLVDKKDPLVKNIIKNYPQEERLNQIQKLSVKIKVCNNSEPESCGAIQPKYVVDSEKIIAEWSVSDGNGKYRKEKHELAPDRTLLKFKNISEEDALILGFHKNWCLPHWLICTILPVVPPSARPSVRLYNNQKSEDDLTHKYIEIIKNNNSLKKKLEKNSGKINMNSFNINVKAIQYLVTTLMDNDPGGGLSASLSRAGRPFKGIRQRIQGKDARIRSNLMGKRVDFSARTVISPDPNIEIGQLGVPKMIAMNLTVPEVVNENNINKMYKLVRNGHNVYPGAKEWVKVDQETGTQQTISLTYVNDLSSVVLSHGDIIHRHLENDDYVLFNRQPSLHKMSMMGHRALIIDSLTFKLNIDVCKPYNADFDGDEMNMHVPQSLQAKMELKHITAVPKQIISPSSSSALVAPAQDNLLGLYKITDDEVLFTKVDFMNIIGNISIPIDKLPEPFINKDVGNGHKYQRWTGKQAISLILPPINIINDSVVIKNGIIEKGQIDKGIAGKIVHNIFKDYGYKEAERYLNNSQKIVSKYLIRSGFSVGMSDLIVSKEIMDKNNQDILQAKKDANELTRKVHLNIFENVSKGVEEIYDIKIIELLNTLSSRIKDDTLKEIEEGNRVNYMIKSGSKGSPLNLMQMSCMLGQQIADSKRIQLNFNNRTLPYYNKYDNGIESRGFVSNNFKDGLTPQEFFFHAITGRNGLIDTAVKTAQSGYIERKLIKALEDVKVSHDGTVRRANGDILQFVFGSDCYNSIYLEKGMGLNTLFMTKLSDLEDKILLNVNFEWNNYITSNVFNKMKLNKKLSKKFEEYNDYVQNDLVYNSHKYLIPTIPDIKKASDKINNEYIKNLLNIYFPINFNRLVNQTKQLFNLNGKNKSDISPDYIIDKYNELYSECSLMGKRNFILELLINDKLSPKYLITKLRITKLAFEHIINTIKNQHFKSLAQGGEMCGLVSAQSIGEISTQLTLNSVEWNSELLLKIDGRLKKVKIGEWIDRRLDNALDKNIECHPNDTKLEYIKDHKVEILSADKNGKILWDNVSAVTKHPVINKDGSDTLIKIKTRSGREVIATKGKSFLQLIDNELVEVDGDTLKIGDKLPVTDCLSIIKNDYNINNNIKVEYDEIISIEEVKNENHYVYDLTCDITKNFCLSNGLVMRDTFHFAGVGEKSSVNKGVPRLLELLDNRSNLKESQLNIYMAEDYKYDLNKVEEIKYNLELVKISDLLESEAVYFKPNNEIIPEGKTGRSVLDEDKDIMRIYDVFSELDDNYSKIPSNPWVVRLEFNHHKMIEKNISMDDIFIILSRQIPDASIIYSDDNSGKLIFRIRLEFNSNQSDIENDMNLIVNKMNEIENIIIKGVNGLTQVYNPMPDTRLIKFDGNDYNYKNSYYFESNGGSLFDVLLKPYVDTTRTTSINQNEMYQLFGIEAARWTLEEQLTNVFSVSGSSTSPRNIGLLCDFMTVRGVIMSIHRTGLNSNINNIGPLAKCSFEETVDQLKTAGVFGSIDKVDGVSANIMLGQAPNCGTGESKIFLDEERLEELMQEMNIKQGQQIIDTGLDTDLNNIFGGDEYCMKHQDIGFNIDDIDSDDIQLI